MRKKKKKVSGSVIEDKTVVGDLTSCTHTSIIATVVGQFCGQGPHASSKEYRRMPAYVVAGADGVMITDSATNGSWTLVCQR